MAGQLDVSLLLKATDQGFTGELKEARGELKGLANDARTQGRAMARELEKPIGARINEGVTRWRDTWNRASGSVKTGVGNIGLQLQDVLVQAQQGVSPLQIILQQGTQIAGAFGPTGAIAGAIGAGVLVGISAFRSLSDDGLAVAQQAAKDFDEALKAANGTLADGVFKADDLVKSYEGLSTRMEALGAVKLADDMRDLTKETERQRQEFANLVDQLEDAANNRLLFGGSGLADVSGLAGQLTPVQAEATQRVIGRFRSGEISDVRFAAEIQATLSGATDEAQALSDTLVELQANAEQGEISLKRMAEARKELGDLAAAGGESLANLGADLRAVNEEVEKNKSSWASWYDALVGHSYIPDTVTESEIWFDRLGASMTSTTREATSNVADAFIGLDSQISGTLARMITSNKLALTDFADFSLDISTSILQSLIQIGINSGLNLAFAPSAAAGPRTGPGGLLVGGGVTSAGAGPAGGPTPLFPAGVLHGGGVVGERGSMRLVDPAVFAGAERYHGGGTVLRPGEVPIIAERGERITPAGQGGGTVVNVYAPPGAQVERRQRRGPQGEAIEDVFIRMGGQAIGRGDWDGAMRSRFGLTPGGG